MNLCLPPRFIFVYSVTCRPIARQRIDKHIPTEANARNNRPSIARQRRSKHARLFSVLCVPRGYRRTQKTGWSGETGVRRVSGRQTAGNRVWNWSESQLPWLPPELSLSVLNCCLLEQRDCITSCSCSSAASGQCLTWTTHFYDLMTWGPTINRLTAQ
jgi:hypothetical protein